MEPLHAHVGRVVASNEFLKVDCCVFMHFPSQFQLRLANMVFGQRFAWTKANFAWSPRPCYCAAFRVGGKTPRRLLLCEKKVLNLIVVYFLFFLSINSRWTQT